LIGTDIDGQEDIAPAFPAEIEGHGEVADVVAFDLTVTGASGLFAHAVAGGFPSGFELNIVGLGVHAGKVVWAVFDEASGVEVTDLAKMKFADFAGGGDEEVIEDLAEAAVFPAPVGDGARFPFPVSGVVVAFGLIIAYLGTPTGSGGGVEGPVREVDGVEVANVGFLFECRGSHPTASQPFLDNGRKFLGLALEGDEKTGTENVLWGFTLEDFVGGAEGTGGGESPGREGGVGTAVLTFKFLAGFAPSVGCASLFEGFNFEFKFLCTFADEFFFGWFVVAAVGAFKTAIRDAVSSSGAALGTGKFNGLLVFLGSFRGGGIEFDARDSGGNGKEIGRREVGHQ